MSDPSNTPETFNELLPLTPDGRDERLTELKRLFPDLFTNEGRLNPDELKQLVEPNEVHETERYEFKWYGKAASKREAFTPTTATLVYDETRSVNPDKADGNMIIEGENLETLKLLLNAYREQVKCIYIDPPYNTGGDFVYKDNFREEKAKYWEEIGVSNAGVKLETNTKADGRYHSNWLSMMHARLLAARQLLHKNEGIIFVSIDDNEVTHLRKLMDEVFGEECFVAIFPWKKRTAKSDVPYGISQDFEWIVCYARSEFIAGLEFTRNYYKTDDYEDRWRLADLTKQTTADERDNSAFDLIDPKTGKVYPFNPRRVWAITKEIFQDYYDKGKIVFPDDYDFLGISIPAFRVFETEDKAKALKKFGEDTAIKAVSTQLPKEVGMTETGNKMIDMIFGGRPFGFSKPPNLIKHFLNIIRSKDFLALDFFAGSGSMCQAILELNKFDGGNRRFVAIQIPEKTQDTSEAAKLGFKTISSITIERVKRVIQGYGENPDPLSDTGFKVYKLQKSNFPRCEFKPNPAVDETENVAALRRYIDEKEAAFFLTLDPQGEQAVFDEVMLKNGFQLHYTRTRREDFADNTVYEVTDPRRSALVCLAWNESIKDATIKRLRDLTEAGESPFFICLERSLSTTSKWNLRHFLGKHFNAF